MKHLGYSVNEQEAAQTYNEYISANFPMFGKLNQIDLNGRYPKTYLVKEIVIIFNNYIVLFFN